MAPADHTDNLTSHPILDPAEREHHARPGGNLPNLTQWSSRGQQSNEHGTGLALEDWGTHSTAESLISLGLDPDLRAKDLQEMPDIGYDPSTISDRAQSHRVNSSEVTEGAPNETWEMLLQEAARNRAAELQKDSVRALRKQVEARGLESVFDTIYRATGPKPDVKVQTRQRWEKRTLSRIIACEETHPGLSSSQISAALCTREDTDWPSRLGWGRTHVMSEDGKGDMQDSKLLSSLIVVLPTLEKAKRDIQLLKYQDMTIEVLRASAQTRGIGRTIAYINRSGTRRRSADPEAWERRTLARILLLQDLDKTLSDVDLLLIPGVDTADEPIKTGRKGRIFWDEVVRSVLTETWRQACPISQMFSKLVRQEIDVLRTELSRRSLAETFFRIRERRKVPSRESSRQKHFWDKVTMTQTIAVHACVLGTSANDLEGNEAIGSVEKESGGTLWNKFVRTQEKLCQPTVHGRKPRIPRVLFPSYDYEDSMPPPQRGLLPGKQISITSDSMDCLAGYDQGSRVEDYMTLQKGGVLGSEFEMTDPNANLPLNNMGTEATHNMDTRGSFGDLPAQGEAEWERSWEEGKWARGEVESTDDAWFDDQWQ